MREKDRELANALGEKANEYMGLNPCVTPKTYAPNSKFYEQVMEDGYVFNPYIHRRWLPAQFECNDRMYSHNIASCIRNEYTYSYTIRYTLDEVNKLISLQRHDVAAYEERSKFFTLDAVKSILLSLLDSLKERINTQYGIPYTILKEYQFIYRHQYKIVNNRKILIDDKSQALETLGMIRDKIANASNYYDIKRAVKIEPRFFEIIRSCYLPKSEDFVEAFWKSGVYYTLKNDIMFEHRTLDGLRGAEACVRLRDYLNAGYTAQQFQEIYNKNE